jgi:hypothetical protein
MSDGEDLREPLVLHDYDFVADLGLRTDAEGNRQDTMVAHNEEKNLALPYATGGRLETEVATLEAKTPLATAPPPVATSFMAGAAVDTSLPFVKYRSKYQEQFGQSVDDAVIILMTEHDIAEVLEPEFKAAITSCAQSFKRQSSRTMLPDEPERDYRPGEGILNYLRSLEGFGPWIAAGEGVLTRPLIREKAPKAYTALANWLRSNDLPDDLAIPTKSEALDAELASRISVREARRIARRGDRQRPSD